MPWELAEHIRNYISGSRKLLLASLNVSEKVAKQRIFVSVRTGAPLLDRTCSQIFADGFRSLGAPKGAGVHAIRRYKAESTADEEIRFRHANKLPVTKEDVEKVVQETLGQGTAEAQRAYHRAIGRRRKTSPEVALRTKLEASMLEKDVLRAQVQSLRAEVERLGKVSQKVGPSRRRS